MTSSILLLLLYVIPLTLQLESDTFRIFNKENRKCLHALSDMIKVSDCSKDSNTQKFRWISKDRLINVAVPKCLAVSAKNEMSLVSLSSCDAESELQKWECKNDTLFGIQGESLYLNYGNKNVIISKALGSWSRWSIYGTSDDLCAKAYEEIYSIKGNGDGKPCVFPFKYKSKWYADCTTDGAENADLWCATIQDYDKDPQWGYCPIKSTREGWWATDSISGFLYQVNQDAALTWYQARKSCHQQDAELLSITEVHEQTYMSGVANSHALTLWTGLHNLDLNAGWKWTDGSPFRFLNWRPGYPVVENGKNCVVLEPDENGKWENLKCSERLGYVCKKGNITSYTSPSDTKPINCPPTWISYAGYCYYLHREAKNWQDAKVSCRKEEGDLASLHNIEESSFVNSIFQFDSEHIWLGLNDLKTQMYFEWSDGTPVTYTIWEKGEPSHIDNRQEDCVALNPKVGQWSDQSCEKKFPYMCKRKPLPFDHERLPIIEPGCSTGWKRHGFYCYYIGEEISTFSEANSSCNAHSAFLMTVDDRLEQAYLTSLIGLRPEKYFWTGLSDIEERGIFKWTTSDRVLYSHWDADMPGRKQGCVVMRTGNKGGLWDVINCDETAKFVCKKWAEGVTPPPIPTTTPEPKCPPEWRTSSHISSCFKSYSKPNGEKKRWTEAREFCQAIGGELASINNRDEQDVVLSAMLAVGVTSGSWIGLVSSDPSEGFQWSDGSPLIYENWRFGEPNNYQGIEMCAEIDNTFNMRWNDRPCEYLKDWICELKKGAALIPEPTNSPYPEFNLTHDGWLIRGDKQYYVGKTEMSMDKARDFCRHNYGNLVTINDEEERTFLWRYILKNRTHDSYYIGLVLSVDKQFRWMDGSPVDYVAWAVNEPNFSNNDENCVEMYKDSGLWNDINCGNPGSFICERHMNNINTTFPPTVPPPRGGCLAGWMAFGGKCYKIFGKNTDELVDWHTGRLECQKWEGNLVTINDDLVQDFLTYNLRDLENPVWIGLNDISQDRRYRWTDQSGVHYTKWAKGHPSYRYMYGKENNVDCVAMEVGERMNAGSWTEIDCKLERGFICQKSEDPSLPVGTTVSPPPDHYQLGNASYTFQKTKKNWHEAQRMCKESDYELASIIDPYSASFIRIQIHTFKEPFWVGLYSNNQTDNRYKWTDDWKLRYTRWAPDEPKEKSACVYVDVDGQWKTASCDENYASVCWQTSAKAPIEPPQKPGKCPESSSQAWIPFHEHCYIVEASDSYTWGQASIKCLQLNGNMVSIEDQHEQDFLFEHAELLSDKENAFWIGLYRNVEGNWLWMDKTAMDYVNWDRGGPSDSSVSEEDILIRYRFYSYEQTFNRDCVSMDAKSGIWINYDCSGRKGYICKTLKIPVSSDNTTQPEKFKQDQRPSHGVAVGVSLLVIAIIASATIVAYLVYRKKPTKVPDTEPQNFDNTLYFSSSQDASVQDTNILINNMEQL